MPEFLDPDHGLKVVDENSVTPGGYVVVATPIGQQDEALNFESLAAVVAAQSANPVAQLKKTGHGLVIGDVGKPLFNTTIFDDLNQSHYVTGIMTDYVDVNHIRTAAPGSIVTLNVSLLQGGNLLDTDSGRNLWFDKSAGLYKQARQLDSFPFMLPQLYVLKVDTTTFTAVVLETKAPEEPTGVFKVYPSGNATTDNARIAFAVSQCIAWGDGSTLFFSSSKDYKELHITTEHNIPSNSVNYDQSLDLEVIRDNAAASLFWGASYLPWNLSGIISSSTGIAANTNILSNLTGGTPEVGAWYAFWSDDNVTDATFHSASEPQRPCEFHRIARQEIGAVTFSLVINASAGTYTLTINGLTTAAIAYNANAATIQSALLAVTGAGKLTVTGTGPFTISCADTYLLQHNTMSIGTGSLTTTGSNTVTATSSILIPSWILDDTTHDAMTTGFQMVKIPTIAGITIRNLRMKMLAGVAPSGSPVFLGGCVDYLMENCRMGDKNGRMNPGSINTVFCTGLRKNLKICDHEDPNNYQAIYYGITDSVTNYTITSHSIFGCVRHATTTGARARTISATNYRYGTGMNLIYESCVYRYNNNYNPTTAAQTTSPMQDFHSEYVRVTSINCHYHLTANQAAFNIRSRHVTFINPTIHATAAGITGYIRGKGFTMIGGEINGGFYMEVSNTGTQPNVDNARFVGVTWKNTYGSVLIFKTGTGHEVTGCYFYNTGAGLTSFSPKSSIYVQSLTNSSSTISVCNNYAPKVSNDSFFYASTLTFPQLQYIGNTAPGYGGSNIGIETIRKTGDVAGSIGTVIDVAIEWEMMFGVCNGYDNLRYIHKVGHGLTNSDVGKPITSAHTIFNDTTPGLKLAGYLKSVVSVDYYTLYGQGETFFLPKTSINGSYNDNSDPRDLYWDLSLSGGKHVTTKPGDSAADVQPFLYVNTYSANLLQVTIPIPTVATGGSGSGSSTFRWPIVIGDETTNLTTGTSKVTTRVPMAITLTDVRLSVNTAPTGASILVDINKNGVSIFTTRPSIAASSKTSVGGTPHVFVTTNLAEDDEVTVDIDQIGSTIAGKGLKVWLIGTIAGTTPAVQPLTVPVGPDETSALAVTVDAATFRMPAAFTLNSIRASVATAPGTNNILVDVNKNGVSIFSTRLRIDASQKTSVTSAAPYVLTGATSFAADDEVTIDIDQVGAAGNEGKGLEVTLIGTFS